MVVDATSVAQCSAPSSTTPDTPRTEACGAVVALCAETADAETAVALWRAVCAADAGVRLAAALWCA